MAVDPLAASALATDQEFVPAAAKASAHPTWSGWTRCHSTFSFVFAPPRPGVFVLAEEVGAIEAGRRMLAVVEVAECTDLGRALSALFTGRLRERAAEARCFVRYAVVDDREERRRIQAALARSLAPTSDLVRPAEAAPASKNTAKNAAPETALDQRDRVARDQRNGITSVVVSAPDFISDRDPGDESDSCANESNVETNRSRQGTRAPFPAGF